MKSNEIYQSMKRDLSQLIEDLEHFQSGKEETFDFDLFTTKKGCGTAHCFLGENPERHPDTWMWDRWDRPVLLKGQYDSAFSPVSASAMEFYNLKNRDEVAHLFCSHEQDVNKYGGYRLDGWTTRAQLAQHIWEFIELFHDGEIPEEPNGGEMRGFKE